MEENHETIEENHRTIEKKIKQLKKTIEQLKKTLQKIEETHGKIEEKNGKIEENQGTNDEQCEWNILAAKTMERNLDDRTKKNWKKNNLISHPFSIGVFYVATICLKRTGHERLSRRHERRTLLQSAMRIPKKTKMIITQSKE